MIRNNRLEIAGHRIELCGSGVWDSRNKKSIGEKEEDPFAVWGLYGGRKTMNSTLIVGTTAKQTVNVYIININK